MSRKQVYLRAYPKSPAARNVIQVQAKWSIAVFDLLLPADEQPSKAVQPRMGPLDDPAPGSITGDLFLCGHLLPTSTNVGSISPGSYQLMNLWIVIALIHAHVLCFFLCWLRSLNDYGFQSGLNKLHIVAVSTIYSKRNAIAFCQQAPLCAAFPPISRGLGPVPFSPQRCLGHCPVHCLPFPIQTFLLIIFQ